MMPVRRDIRFTLPANQILDWHAGGPRVTHFFNALSIFFPVGERFFISSVRNYHHKVTDTALRRAAIAFIGQEAMHGREHEKYNQLMQDSGMPADTLERTVALVLGTTQRMAPRSIQLAVTLALEHHTAIIADLLLDRPGLLEGSQPDFKRLWQWHSLEETEHKSVAYDVWNEAIGSDGSSYLIRAVVMLFTSLAFWTLVAAFTVVLIETDPGTRRQPGGYAKLESFLFGRKGMLRGTLAEWQRYFDYSFHPWQKDNRHLLRQIAELTSGTLPASPAPNAVPPKRSQPPARLHKARGARSAGALQLPARARR